MIEFPHTAPKPGPTPVGEVEAYSRAEKMIGFMLSGHLAHAAHVVEQTLGVTVGELRITFERDHADSSATLTANCVMVSGGGPLISGPAV